MDFRISRLVATVIDTAGRPQGRGRGRPPTATVRAALSLPWSNGPAEGRVNRLKTIKRNMYGRAKFDLLRNRVLHAA